MSNKAPAPFAHSFAELLHLELRRQGATQSASLISAMTPCISQDPPSGPNSPTATANANANANTNANAESVVVVRMAFDQLGIGDREAIAIAETLLKLSAPAMMRSHRAARWALSLRGNAVTDRAAPHMELLLSRCAPPLASLDVRETFITTDAARRLEGISAHCALLWHSAPVVRPLSALTDERSSVGPFPFSFAFSCPLRRSSSVRARRGIDAEALRRRRSELFKSRDREEAATPLQHTMEQKQQRQDQKQEEEEEKEEEERGEEEKEEKKEGDAEEETHLSDPRTLRRPQSSWLQQPSAYRRVSSSARAGTAERADVYPVNKPQGAHNERREDERILLSSSSSQQPLPSRQCRRASSAGPTARTDLNSKCLRTAHAGETSSPRHSPVTNGFISPSLQTLPTAATAVCDKADPIDLTANMNPLLCTVLDLSDAVRSGALQRDYGVDSVWDAIATRSVATNAPFASLTILTLCRNGLTALRCQLPSSLLRLDVSENELRELDGLAQCRMLTYLSARHNRLQSMRGLEHNLAIAHLFLGHNEITIVDGIAHLFVLETLDLSHNRLRTQSSIRPLSLSSALRHVMLRGNPVMDRIQHCYRPLLRNLCPSLQCIDDDRLIFSRLAAGAQLESDGMRMPHASDDALFAGNLDSARPDVSQSANYIHLLSRSVSGRTSSSSNIISNHTNGSANGSGSGGYGDGAHAKTTARAIRTRAETDAQRRRRAAVRSGGEPLRRQMLKRLALESKRFLESVVVERLTGMQSFSALGHIDRDEDSKSSAPDESPVASTPSTGAKLRGVSPLSSPPDERTATATTTTKGTTTTTTTTTTTRRKTKTKISPAPPSTGIDVGSAMSKARMTPAAHYGAQEAVTNPCSDHFIVEVHMDDGLTPDAKTAESATVDSYAALYAATRTRRDETLDHEQWIRLRVQRREPRSVPFGETPIKAEGARAMESHTCGISPIRREVGASLEHSANSTQILREVDSLSPLVPRASPPRVLSPVSVQAPVRAVRIAPTSREVSSSSLGLSSSSLGARRRRDLMLSPPPLCAPPPNDKDKEEEEEEEKREKESVRAWVLRLREDAAAVHAALRTVVGLIDAQRVRLVGSGGYLLPDAFAEERRACAEILRGSGMLRDTEVPANVAARFRFTAAELNQAVCDEDDDDDDESDDEANEERGRGNRDIGVEGTARDRLKVLREIRMLGDGKTCLRYMVLLMEEGKERDLRRYVDEIKELLM